MATDNHNGRPGEKGDSPFAGSDNGQEPQTEREQRQQTDIERAETEASETQGEEQPKEDELINISSAEDVNIDEANETREEEEDESPPPPVANTPN